MVRTVHHWHHGRLGVSSSILGSRAQVAFFSLVLVEALLVIGLVAAVFGLVEIHVREQTALLKTIPTYLAIFVFGSLFVVILTLDALRLRNIIQIFGILFFNLCILLYSALQIVQTREALFKSRPAWAVDEPENCSGDLYLSCRGSDSLYRIVEILLIIVPCVVGVVQLVITWLSWVLYREFGWEIFKSLGGDPRQKNRYRWQQILITLLKLDWFFFVGFTVQFLIVVPTSFLNRAGGGGTTEWALTVAAVPISLLVIAGCILAVKRELKWLMAPCLLILLAGTAYFCFKLASLWLPKTRRYFDSTRNTLAVFSVMSIILLCLTFAIGIKVWLSFGKGLLDAQEPKRPVLAAFSSSVPHQADKDPQHPEQFVIE